MGRPTEPTVGKRQPQGVRGQCLIAALLTKRRAARFATQSVEMDITELALSAGKLALGATRYVVARLRRNTDIY